jgi:hypothetical protein
MEGNICHSTVRLSSRFNPTADFQKQHATYEFQLDNKHQGPWQSIKTVAAK